MTQCDAHAAVHVHMQLQSNCHIVCVYAYAYTRMCAYAHIHICTHVHMYLHSWSIACNCTVSRELAAFSSNSRILTNLKVIAHAVQILANIQQLPFLHCFKHLAGIYHCVAHFLLFGPNQALYRHLPCLVALYPIWAHLGRKGTLEGIYPQTPIS